MRVILAIRSFNSVPVFVSIRGSFVVEPENLKKFSLNLVEGIKYKRVNVQTSFAAVEALKR
jgi:hypothetical protein